ASLGAMSAEQAYVTISRGRERGMIFTDLSRDELLAAVARADNRKSATEVFLPRPQADGADGRPARQREADRAWEFLQRVRGAHRQGRRQEAAQQAARADGQAAERAREFAERMRGAERQRQRKAAASLPRRMPGADRAWDFMEGVRGAE